MSDSPNRKIPNEDELVDLLGRFKPAPTPGFHQRMQSAPWQYRPKPSRLAVLRLAWAVPVLLVILLLAAAVFVPQVRTIARQVFFSFMPAATNQIEVQVAPASQGELFNYTDPANFILSLEDAQGEVAFHVGQIQPVPAGLVLVGARYEADYGTVILLYKGDGFSLLLTQRLRGNGQDVFSIGSQATVSVVEVNGAQGEFVQGGWKAVSTQAVSDHQTPQNPIKITAVWDDSLPQSTLRWQAENMVYELRAVGEGRPSQPELINWANELK